jgi:hypothetical protein
MLNTLPGGSARQMGLELLIPVCQIAHDLLSLPRYSPSTDTHRPLAAAAELVRLSAIALMSTVITCTSGDYLYYAANRRGPINDLMVEAHGGGWAGLDHLKLWALVIQTMMELGPKRSQYLDEIKMLMRTLGLCSWQGLLHCLHRIAWLTDAATEDLAHLKNDIEAIFQRPDYQPV